MKEFENLGTELALGNVKFGLIAVKQTCEGWLNLGITNYNENIFFIIHEISVKYDWFHFKLAVYVSLSSSYFYKFFLIISDSDNRSLLSFLLHSKKLGEFNPSI